LPPLFFYFSLPLVYIIAPLRPVVKSFFEKSQNKKSRANALLTGINGVVFYNILCTEALFPAAFSRIECIARQL
jgi:nitrate reductase beta subunit